jgi:hypothetical protein
MPGARASQLENDVQVVTLHHKLLLPPSTLGAQDWVHEQQS